MRAFPIVHIVDPRDRRDVLLSVSMIDPALVEAFVGEVAHELAALLGVNREAAAPLVCGDARIGGRHLWRNNGKTMQGTLLICACGARAREGFDGDLFEEHGYGPPPANRVASTERAA